MDVAVTQYLLGIRPALKGLVIDPSIPSDWDGYKVTRVYRGCKLNIEVQNPKGVQHGVERILIDGVQIDGNIITPEILVGRHTAKVTVTMG